MRAAAPSHRPTAKGIPVPFHSAPPRTPKAAAAVTAGSATPMLNANGGNGGSATAIAMGNGSTTNVQGVTVQADARGGLGGLANGIGFSPGIGGDASASATGTSTGAANIITEAYGGASPGARRRFRGGSLAGHRDIGLCIGEGLLRRRCHGERIDVGRCAIRQHEHKRKPRPPASCFQVLVLPMDCKLPPT